MGGNACNAPRERITHGDQAASIVAPLLWMKAVQRPSQSRASMFFSLTPLFTAVIAAMVLHETMNAAQWLGALTIAGVLLAERWQRPLCLSVACGRRGLRVPGCIGE